MAADFMAVIRAVERLRGRKTAERSHSNITASTAPQAAAPMRKYVFVRVLVCVCVRGELRVLSMTFDPRHHRSVAVVLSFDFHWRHVTRCLEINEMTSSVCVVRLKNRFSFEGSVSETQIQFSTRLKMTSDRKSSFMQEIKPRVWKTPRYEL